MSSLLKRILRETKVRQVDIYAGDTTHNPDTGPPSKAKVVKNKDVPETPEAREKRLKKEAAILKAQKAEAEARATPSQNDDDDDDGRTDWARDVGY
jgi:hypothetical protein